MSSGVVRIWNEEGHETERKQFKGNTQSYYEILAINSDKAISLNNYVLLDRQPRGMECQSLCGSEVTIKIKQLEVEGRTCPSAP